MKASQAFLAVMTMAAFAATTLSEDYTVGDAEGWTTNVDYDAWASDKKFVVGDTIKFNYDVYHNVLEVTPENYQTCNSTNALSTHSGGSTTFTLASTGTRYFICGITRHCGPGKMHVNITTLPSSTKPEPKPKKKHTPGPGPAPAPAPLAANLDMTVSAAPAAVPSTGVAVARYSQPVVAVTGLALAVFVSLAV